MKVEGGAPAYCPRCREHGHYGTAHTMAPILIRPDWLPPIT